MQGRRYTTGMLAITGPRVRLLIVGYHHGHQASWVPWVPLITTSQLIQVTTDFCNGFQDRYQ